MTREEMGYVKRCWMFWSFLEGADECYLIILLRTPRTFRTFKHPKSQKNRVKFLLSSDTSIRKEIVSQGAEARRIRLFFFIYPWRKEKTKLAADARSEYFLSTAQAAAGRWQSNRHGKHLLAIRDSLGRQTVARSLAEWFDMNREMCWCQIP